MIFRFFTVTTQVRYAHTDIQVPDFSDYRRSDVQSSSASNKASADSRKSFTYLVVGGKAEVTIGYHQILTLV